MSASEETGRSGTQISAAALFQKWAEMFKRQAETESSAALKWLFTGAAMAMEICAQEMRERADPTVTMSPTQADVGFSRDVLRAVLEMARQENGSD